MKTKIASLLVSAAISACAQNSPESSHPQQTESNMNYASLETIDQFLSQAGAFFLATTDGAQPKLRPLGAHHFESGRLWFGVGEFKNVYRQLAANPLTEIVALLPDGGTWLRYTGRAVFATGDEREVLEEKFLNDSPGLRSIYDKKPGHRMMCFYLADARAEKIAMMPPGEVLLEDAAPAWDRTFPASDKVEHGKVTFRNRFGILLSGDVYKPKDSKGRLPAVAVCGPFGAVKEQCSGLYAQTLAERGFLAIAFDPSYTGESGGFPRDVASIDINTEDFSACVDELLTREDVDPDKIGMVGICGWGGIVLNAAASDTRVKASVAVTLYEMTRIAAKGYFDQADTPEARRAAREAMNAQRTQDALAAKRGEPPAHAGGVVDPLPEDAPVFVKDYFDYYKTPRGYHPRSLNSNAGWLVTSGLSLLNTDMLARIGEIESAVLVVHGEKAHSRYMGEDVFSRLKGDNKQLLIVPGASHCDLYDGGGKDAIPFDAIEAFLKTNLGVAGQ